MTRFRRTQAAAAALLLAGGAGALLAAQSAAQTRTSLTDLQNQIDDLTVRVEVLEGEVPVPEFDIVVALDGTGDFTDPITAVESIVDASAGRPYVVKIMPGTYDLGPDSLQMKPYVDIEGSGRTATRIVGNAPGSPGGVVLGASNAELRMLTVEHTGNAFGAANAIHNLNASPAITDVQAIVQDSPLASAIFNEFAAPLITNVTVIASSDRFARGIHSRDSTVTLIDIVAQTSTTSTTSNSPGIYNEDSDATMTNVVATLRGVGNAVYNFGSIVTMAQVDATVHGCGSGVSNLQSVVTMTGVTATSSARTTDTCSSNLGVQNFESDSVDMTDVTASASGPDRVSGVRNRSSSAVTMTRVTAVASGGSRRTSAVENILSSAITMVDLTATANGGSSAMGVQNEASAPVVITNSTITASGGAFSSFGVWGRGDTSTSSVIVNITGSLISGSTYSLFPERASSFFVEDSRIDGQIAFPEHLVCINVTDLSGNPLGPDCQP